MVPQNPPRVEVEGQHIFPDDELHQLAIRWKELNSQRHDAEAMLLLGQIIERSTPMFERLAQHEKFHHTVDLDILVGAAQEKVVKWLLRWEPAKGKLFTWFSKCSKHAFLSELVKVNGYRRRFHATSDSLERFIGAEDHAVDKHDLETEMKLRLQTLTCRWGHPQEIGCIHYLIDCILDEDNRDKQAAIRAASYAFCVTPDMAKFFYRWAVCELRGLFIDKIRVSITDDDLLYLSETYTPFVDIADTLGIESAKLLIAKHGGTRIKIPTLAHVLRLKENYKIWQEIEDTDKDPDSIAEVAARHKKTARSATEAYEEMCEILNPRRAGEYYVFRENDEHE